MINLSDQATTNLLDLGAWSEGEKLQYSALPASQVVIDQPFDFNDVEVDSQIPSAISTGNESEVTKWLSRLGSSAIDQERVTRVFAATAHEAPESMLKALVDTNLVNLQYADEINQRNCLHNAAIFGRHALLAMGLSAGVSVKRLDIYGRIPLHYAAIHGRVEIVQELIAVDPSTIDFKDQDNFTPLIHSITHGHLACVQTMLDLGASKDRGAQSDHIPLNLACQAGSVPIVETLLARGPQIIPDAEGLFPQHLVARSGKSPQLLLTLAKHGVDLNQTDKLYQWTPLFHAVSEGHLACLETLLYCNVKTDILDEKGYSALYYAAWEGHNECMKLLTAIEAAAIIGSSSNVPHQFQTIPSTQITPVSMIADVEGIPPISLPPPIIPFRRYGHNFLDTKTFVVIMLDNEGSDPIQFYDNNKYPAARLTISSKSSDLIPRNILLPVQDEHKTISFQIDNLDAFSIDFDIFPTFGSKVIARTVASSGIFTEKDSSAGRWHLELFDARLRAIGRINFNYHVVKPYRGIPLEITHFETYWKAISQLGSHPGALVTGSSLSGQYVRLFVQLTGDGVPVLYPQWKVNHHGLDVPVSGLSYNQFTSVGTHNGLGNLSKTSFQDLDVDDVTRLHQTMAYSFATLQDALRLLPPEVHVELHILYPSSAESRRLRLGPTLNMNDSADAILTVLFEHARYMREQAESIVRPVVFSSYNQDMCIALNWKQPNCKCYSNGIQSNSLTFLSDPVLLCNDLGLEPTSPETHRHSVYSGGQATMSVKEAVKVAQSNNFMGLICRSRLLVSLVPMPLYGFC
jgi:CDK inhibitor PHO81